MTVDWDGEFRMDRSSSHSMTGLVGMKERFDLAFATEPNDDCHGIVTRSAGLPDPEPLPGRVHPYLFHHRPKWRAARRSERRRRVAR